MSKQSTRRINMFHDVKEVLDKVLLAGGGEVTLETYGKAVHWRHRAYTFRKMFATQVTMDSPYDKLTLRRVQPGTSTVRIDIIGQPAIFTPRPSGLPLAKDDEETASYEEEAKRLAQELGIDE